MVKSEYLSIDDQSSDQFQSNSTVQSEIYSHNRKMPRLSQLCSESWFLRLGAVSICGCFLSHFNVYHVVVMNNLFTPFTDWLASDYDPDLVDTLLMPLMVSSTHVGMLLGGTFLTAYVVDGFGRRHVNIGLSLLMMFSALLLTAGILICNYYMILIARLLTGFAFGMAIVSVNLLLAESSPIYLRGAFTSLPIVFYSLGDMFGVLLSSPYLLGSDELWPYAMLLGYIPSIIALPVFIWSHESPRHLYLKEDDADRSTGSLHFYQGHANSETTLKDLRNEKQRQARNVSYSELWTNRWLRESTELIVSVLAACQLAGITVVVQFSTPILEHVGLSHDQASTCTVVIAMAKFATSFIGMPAVELLGRRLSCLVGLCVCASCLLMVALMAGLLEASQALGWTIAGVFVLYMTTYNVLSAAVSALCVELMPQQARAKALVTAHSVSFLLAASVSFVFPIVVQAVTSFPLPAAILSFFAFVMLAYLAAKLPETAGRTFQETQDELQRLIQR